MEVYANTQRKLSILPEVLRENVGAIILEFIRKNTGIQLDDPQDPAYREDEPVTEDDDAESWQKLFESVSEETRQWMTDLIDGESGDCSALGMHLDSLQSFLDLVKDFQKKDYCADLLEIPQTKTVMVNTGGKADKKSKQAAEERRTTPYERDAAAIKQTAAWMRVGTQMLMAAKEQNLLNTWEQEINEIKNDSFISYKSEYLTSWFRSVVDVLYAFFDQMKTEDAAKYDDLCLGLLAEHDQIMSLIRTWLETHREAMSSHREIQTVRKALTEAQDNILVLQSQVRQGDQEELKKTQRLLEQSEAKILELGRELDRTTQERDDLIKRAQSFDIDSTKAQRMVADLERRNDELEQQCAKLLMKSPTQATTKAPDNKPLLDAFQALASNFGIVCQFQDGADPMIEVSRVISSLSDF